MERGWKPNTEVAPPCPRCGSSNTKFCYYNNYSLTQPRYFCKSCRRYWTKGGSLRNVPVGGGCRKSRRAKATRAAAAPITAIQSNLSAAPEPTSTSIDLAAVYANFLTQPPPQNRIQFPEGFHANQQESGFLECGSFPVRLSEFGAINSTSFQFSTAAGMNQIEGDVFPPAMWASSDMILQNDEISMLEVEATCQQNSDAGNMSPNFSGFNLEAIFRS